MAGMLFYGSDFAKEWYLGVDELQHYVIAPVSGDFYTITNSTWDELVIIAERYGIPARLWPVYHRSIDMPIKDVKAANGPLRQAAAQVSLDQLPSDPIWLKKIIQRLHANDLVVYCRN